MARKKKRNLRRDRGRGKIVITDAMRQTRKVHRVWLGLARDIAGSRRELVRAVALAARFKGGSWHGDICHALAAYMAGCVDAIRHGITGSGTVALCGESGDGMIGDLADAARWAYETLRTDDEVSPVIIDAVGKLALDARTFHNRVRQYPTIEADAPMVHAQPIRDGETLREVRIMGKVIISTESPIHIIASVVTLEHARQTHKARIADLEDRIAQSETVLRERQADLRLLRSRKQSRGRDRDIMQVWRDSERIRVDLDSLRGRLADLQNAGYPTMGDITRAAKRTRAKDRDCWSQCDYADGIIAAKILLGLATEKPERAGDITVRRVDPRRPDLADGFQTRRRG